MVHDAFPDPEGRFILLQASCEGWPITLLNVYTPTTDHPEDQISLLDKLEMLLGDYDVSNFMIGGDFNCCIDPDKDRFSGCEGSGPPPSPAREPEVV